MKKLVVVLAVVFSGIVFSQTKPKSSPKYKLTDLVNITWDYHLDSMKFIFIRDVAIKKLNAIRKTKGMNPLIVDFRLAPAVYHHSFYLNYVYDHDIKDVDGWHLTHTERFDIPNFTEILEPWDRIKLLEPCVFKEIREELTGIGYNGRMTFDQVAVSTLNGYKACDAHWNALTTNPNLDAIFMYINQHGTVITILGDYF